MGLVSGITKTGSGFLRYFQAKDEIDNLPDYQQHTASKEVNELNAELERRYQNPFTFSEENALADTQAMQQEQARVSSPNTLSGVLDGESSGLSMNAAASKAGEGARRRGGYLSALANLSRIYQENENMNVQGHNARTLESEIALGKAMSDAQMDVNEGFGEYGDQMINMSGGMGM